MTPNLKNQSVCFTGASLIARAMFGQSRAFVGWGTAPSIRTNNNRSPRFNRRLVPAPGSHKKYYQFSLYISYLCDVFLCFNWLFILYEILILCSCFDAVNFFKGMFFIYFLIFD